MWLLRTNRAELHYFTSPDAVTGGYAILSHTWGDHEQTFQQTRAIRERCERTGENPRDLSSEKVRQSCILAECHGYRWIWNDTCCIDKTSSTELSEAINSMLVWYSCAEVCFAYLGDVESDCVLDAKDSAFRTARWHSRGWTLQELIAPFLVIFVSQDWGIIGDKRDLASLLEEITGVQQEVLTHQTHYSAASVAERMSWASERRTTRVEDEAYCLMGLFEVNMPTIYGEGLQAFQRLQQEIMKRSVDTTLLAWPGDNEVLESHDGTSLDSREFYETFDISTRSESYLLADSPRRFRKTVSAVRYTPSLMCPLQPYLDWQWRQTVRKRPIERTFDRQFGPFRRVELPNFSCTPHGVQCRFPIIESSGLTIAVLLCETVNQHIGLLLCPSSDPVQAPFPKKYYATCGFRTLGSSMSSRSFRLISLGNNFYNLTLRLGGNAKKVTAEWRDICIADSLPPSLGKRSYLCVRLHSIKPSPPFRIPNWLIGRLTKFGLELQPLCIQNTPTPETPLLVEAQFVHPVWRERVVIALGTCVHSESPSTPTHWAKASVFSTATWNDKSDYSHDCHEHHVLAWPDGTKNFGDADRTVRLSFSRCSLMPEDTLVVHMELMGCVYDDVKKRENVEFPRLPVPALDPFAHVVDPPVHVIYPPGQFVALPTLVVDPAPAHVIDSDPPVHDVDPPAPSDIDPPVYVVDPPTLVVKPPGSPAAHPIDLLAHVVGPLSGAVLSPSQPSTHARNTPLGSSDTSNRDTFQRTDWEPPKPPPTQGRMLTRRRVRKGPWR